MSNTGKPGKHDLHTTVESAVEVGSLHGRSSTSSAPYREMDADRDTQSPWTGKMFRSRRSADEATTL